MIFTSPLCTDSAQPVPVSDISTLAFKLGRENGFGDDTDALLNIDGPTGKAMSYAEVYEMASQIASGLQNKLRLTKGDVVTTYLLCDIHSHAIIHGTLMAGCSIMMEGPVYPVEEFASRLEQAKPKAIFTHPVHLGQVWAALRMPGVVAAALGGWPKIILTQDIDTGSGQQTNAPEDIEVQTIAELLSTAPYERLSINTWEEMDNTIALIGYSSGTTGKPKGILVPHRTLVSCLHQELTSKVMPLGKSYPCGDDDKGRRFPVDMVTFPPMMVYGVYLHINHLAAGRTLLSAFRLPSERIAQLVERYRIEAMYTTPTVPEEIVARWEDARLARYDWSSFKDLHSAGAPTSEIVVEQFVGQLGARISSPYGSSECLGISFTFADSPQGSVGKLLPGIFAKVVDIQTGKGKSYSLGPNQIGELCIKSNTTLKGYLNNPEATAKAFDRDGFFHVGDVVRMDENGYLYVLGRKSDIIWYQDRPVFPYESERIIRQHPEVKDCVVVAVPDTRSGRPDSQVPRVYIQLIKESLSKSHDGNDNGEQRRAVVGQILEWANSRLDKPNQIRGGGEIIDEIPKISGGKVLRHLLQARYNTEPRD